MLVLTFTSYVTSGKLFNLFILQFSHLELREIIELSHGLLREFSELIWAGY